MVHKRRKYHSRHQITRFHIFLYVVFFATCMLMLSFYFEIIDLPNGGIRIEHSQNYFIETEKYSSMNLIVNTSACQIVDIDKWDPSIMPFVKKNKHPPDCKLKGKQLTFVRDSKIVIDMKALKELGHSLETVSCCYRTITRVEETFTSYNSSADNLFEYSEDCYEMGVETYPKGQFIKVFCKKTDSYVSSVAYENYHAIAMMPKQNKNIERKLNNWRGRNKKEMQRPPNVILVGIDSTSRLNLQRFVPKTIKTLENLGAVEIKGYTKVGENTFPNFIPIMSSYSEDELKKICYFNRYVMMDDCPFVWKEFSQANYLTAHLEDSPMLAIFNYYKTGFVKSPVDYYLRPFMLAVHKDNGSPYIIDCLGYQTVEEVITNYMEDLIKLSRRENFPLFLTSWLTNLSHEDMNDLRFADDTFMKFLERLRKEKALNNTILFFMSDHGYRFGSQRQSISGWYEDKLPALWVYISPDLQAKFPGWRHTLNINSKRLSTPFDIHKTFVHILNVFSPTTMKNMSVRRKRSRSTMGQSLFSELMYERNCDMAGIPDNYCACVPPIKIPLNDSILLEAAQTAVSKINSMIPKQCSRLILYSLIGGAYLNKSKFNKHKIQSDTIIVAFITKPGQFLFEALVNYSRKKNKFSISSDILRMNRINTPTGCISDPGLEVFCYC